MTLPLVSIITPVYNTAGYVRETIESVLNQDYPNLEYIILDDGSSDDSWKIIREYGDRAVIETHPNMGESKTVNKGLRMAHGEFVGLVNADDPLLPGCLAATAQALIDQPMVQAAYPDWNMIDASGKVISHIETPEYSYRDMVTRHQCMPGPGALYRLQRALEIGGWDESLHYTADFDLWLRLGLYGPFQRVPHTLATFRSHSTSKTTAQKGGQMAYEHVRIIRKLFDNPVLPGEIRRLRSIAMSSAYFIGGSVAGDDTGLKRYYYLRAYTLAPRLYNAPAYKDRADHIRWWLVERTRNQWLERFKKSMGIIRRSIKTPLHYFKK